MTSPTTRTAHGDFVWYELLSKLCRGPMTVPSGARVAQLSDPQGATFMLHERPKD